MSNTVKHNLLSSDQDTPTVSVVVYSELNRKTISVPIHKKTTAEDVIIYISKQLNIGPVARHIFALRYGDNEWASPSLSLCEFKYKTFDLRIRFRLNNSGRLKNVDVVAYNYYFLQVREDVLQNRIPDISYDKHKKELVGLGVTDMYRTMLELNMNRERVQNDYKKFIPKEVWKHHLFFVKKPVQESLMQIERAGMRDALYVKSGYLEQFEEMAPNYMTEEFNAVIVDQGVVRPILIKVNPWFHDMPGVRYEMAGKKDEPIHLCSIDELCFISLGPNQTVEVARKNGIPMYITFKSELTMVSFVSLLDGYYRLAVKWTFNLCKVLSTPSLLKLAAWKCHGPVGGEFSYRKLENKGRQEKTGCFVIRESELEYDVFYIDVWQGSKPVSYRIEVKEDKWFVVEDGSMHDSLADLLAHCKKPDGPLKLTDCLPPSEYEESPILLCRLDDGLESVKAEAAKDGLPSRPVIIHPKHLKLYRSKVYDGVLGLTQVHKCQWNSGRQQWIEVARKTVKPIYKEEYTKELLELAGRWSLLTSSAVVKLIGVTLSGPIAMVTEYFPLGPLNKYLRQHRAQIKKVDLVEAATYLANAVWHLEEENIVHGYIRAHKLLVAYHDELTFSVKLADPGIHPTYTERDYHWIPPEHYGFLNNARSSFAADMWAFGTTLWQIFSYGERPCVIDMDVKTFYQTGRRLAMPRQCPSDVYQLMLECWHADPFRRKRSQAAMRDINQLLYQVHNTSHPYDVVRPRVGKRSQEDTLSDVSSVAMDLEQNTVMSDLTFHLSDHTPELLSGGSMLQESANSIDHTSQLLLDFSTDTTSLESSFSGASIFELNQDLNVVLQGRIGQGFYGEVYKGLIEQVNTTAEPLPVAVKKLKLSANAAWVDDFEREIAIMKTLKHPNIVEMKYSIHEPEINLVMEYVEHGSLKNYLNIYRDRLDPMRHILKYAEDVAKGMEYLGEKNIVHRDLAARNILVADEFRVKISDFGLAQFTTNNYYMLKSTRELPIKWFAPESLREGKFSSLTDVWSYGVTLYEMFSFGGEPTLAGYCTNATDLYELLFQGQRLACPTACPDSVYVELMIPCWKFESKERPSFRNILYKIMTIRELRSTHCSNNV